MLVSEIFFSCFPFVLYYKVTLMFSVTWFINTSSNFRSRFITFCFCSWPNYIKFSSDIVNLIMASANIPRWLKKERKPLIPYWLNSNFQAGAFPLHLWGTYFLVIGCFFFVANSCYRGVVFKFPTSYLSDYFSWVIVMKNFTFYCSRFSGLFSYFLEAISVKQRRSRGYFNFTAPFQ